MEIDNYRLSARSKKILQLALKDHNGIIYPHDLFIAACKESAGVCYEIHQYLHNELGPDFLHKIEEECKRVDETAAQELILSKGMQIILEKADEKRRYYRQSFINEGHLIESVLETDEVMNELLTREMKEAIIQMACVPRDMIVRLESVMKKGDMDYKNTIRRAVYSDLLELKQFIQTEFGDRWVRRIDRLSPSDQLPVFLAEQEGEIIGFACFDTEKKGMFGPMGTSSRCRLSSVGKELLHRSLLDMAERGYAYAVIEQAGPIEFYEKVCGAKLI